MEGFWLAATQFFWWTMFWVCAVSLVVAIIFLIASLLYLHDKAKLAETK